MCWSWESKQQEIDLLGEIVVYLSDHRILENKRNKTFAFIEKKRGLYKTLFCKYDI